MTLLLLLLLVAALWLAGRNWWKLRALRTELDAVVMERDMAMDGASADVIEKSWRVDDLEADLVRARAELAHARRTTAKVLEHHDRRNR